MGRVIRSTEPTGTVKPFAGGVVPAPYLPCDGSAVSRTTYAALFAVISTTFGPGDGSTTFNVPDFQGRTPMGDGSGSGLTPRTRGASLGEETHALSTGELASHTHTFTTGGQSVDHSHGFTLYGSGGGSNLPLGNTAGGPAGGFNTNGVNVDHSHSGTTAGQGSGTAHNNIQPSLVIKYMIKF